MFRNCQTHRWLCTIRLGNWSEESHLSMMELSIRKQPVSDLKSSRWEFLEILEQLLKLLLRTVKKLLHCRLRLWLEQ
jgi:hypothetical protein